MDVHPTKNVSIGIDPYPLGSLLGHYLLFTIYSSQAKTYHVGFVDLHRWSMWRSPQRSSPPRSQGAGALHHNIGIIISVYLVTRIPRFAAERANCLNVAELKHLDSRHVSNKNGPKNLDLFHHSWVIPCHRTQGIQGAGALGSGDPSEPSTNSPDWFSPSTWSALPWTCRPHPPMAMEIWRKMMIHQQKHLPTKPDRCQKKRGLKGGILPQDFVVQHIHTSAMPVEKFHRTWWMVHVDTAGWSMSNLCRISVANFAKQKWRLFDILPAIEQLLFLPSYLEDPNPLQLGGSSRPRFRVLKFLHSLLKKHHFKRKKLFNKKSLLKIQKPCQKKYIWQCVKTLYPCSSHQNSWDLWMFIPLKMLLIGIDP